jgi:isoleucyl-tRNA synthetase
MAPILSFTAEEAWQVMAGGKPAPQGAPAGSVFEEVWHAIPASDLDQGTLDAWGNVRQFRELAAKKIEERREAKEIGSSLAAELDIQAHGPVYAALARLGDELRFVLITSRATVSDGNGPAHVKVEASAAPKCERCWHYRADVNPAGLCGRCESNLHGAGEPRRYA